MTAALFARIVAVLGAAFWFVTGIWAFAAPKNFYEKVATFEPYNEHFLHDIGAFSLGLGTALLLPLIVPRLTALAVVLTAGAVAAVFHELAHVIDSDLGGRDTDPVALGFIALLAVAAAVSAWPRNTADAA